MALFRAHVTTLPMGRDEGLRVEVADAVLGGLPAEPAARAEVVNRTLREERARLRRLPDSTRTREDARFYQRIAADLHGARTEPALEAVVRRYVNEIAGRFDPRVHRFATQAVPLLLAGLLHTVDPAAAVASRFTLPDLSAHVRVSGAQDALRGLAARGTVVLVPTHSSNLDSIVLGHALHQLGLPPFAFGAGLNLYENPLLGFFMGHLGAYTIDRQKSDPLYKDTLKTFVTSSLIRGQHQLFFPGGTRSHSGAIEGHLKKGLLGAALTALARGGRPVFVVPCTLTYPIVLEARSLIEGWLDSEGRERWIQPPDEFDRARVWAHFLAALAALDLRVELVLGTPLDPIGNAVDADGGSIAGGRVVDPARYLWQGGRVAPDAARDAELVRRLERALLAAYAAGAVVLPVHVVAFAAFELLRRRAPNARDVFRLLRQVGADEPLALDALEAETARVLATLDARAGLRRDPRCADAATTLRAGLDTLAAYHDPAPLRRAGDEVRVGAAALLLFYRNRLDHLGLAAPLASGGVA